MIAGVGIAAALGTWGVALLRGRARRAKTEMAELPQTCRTDEFEGVAYVLCQVDPAVHPIGLRLAAASGQPLKSLAALAKEQPFLFAMNAGMYHEDMSPVGLHVEEGVEVAPLNRADASGNFFLKPNGVFFVDAAGKAGVQETEAFAASGRRVRIATQSGPMLVIDGGIHPRFEENGESRHVRNGVGVREDGTVVFAISKGPVSLGSFARLFRDGLACPNALFLDGTISALHDGKTYLIGGEYPAGPMVWVGS